MFPIYSQINSVLDKETVQCLFLVKKAFPKAKVLAAGSTWWNTQNQAQQECSKMPCFEVERAALGFLTANMQKTRQLHEQA